MSSRYEEVKEALRLRPRRWLVTGAAGFIGSHLVEALLKLGQQVVGLDNYATGYARNVDEVRRAAGERAARNLEFIDGDIRSIADCRRACARVDLVLHHAALGSVPRSVEDPLASNEVNVTGFVNMLVAAKDILSKNARPTADDVKLGISGILCRCTGYYPILQAIQEASEGRSA